jgi:hypothetical protein
MDFVHNMPVLKLQHKREPVEALMKGVKPSFAKASDYVRRSRRANVENKVLTPILLITDINVP